MTPLLTRAREYAFHNRATAATGAILLVAVIVAVAMWAWNYNNAETWAQRAAAADDRVAAAEAELEAADAENYRLSTLLEKAESDIASLRRNAESVTARAAELDELEAALAEREAAVASTEAQIAASTITGGTWTVGVDVEPGTYRTKDAVIGDCYWAIYRSGTNKDDIIQNDIVQGGFPTVTLSEGQDFESNRCGSWVRQ